MSVIAKPFSLALLTMIAQAGTAIVTASVVLHPMNPVVPICSAMFRTFAIHASVDVRLELNNARVAEPMRSVHRMPAADRRMVDPLQVLKVSKALVFA